MKSLRRILSDILLLSEREYEVLMTTLSRLDAKEVRAKRKAPLVILTRKSPKEDKYWSPAYWKTFPSGKRVRVKGHWCRNPWVTKKKTA